MSTRPNPPLTAHFLIFHPVFLPLYYQACKSASPIASGVDLLALCFSTGPISILTGLSITKTQRYRPQLWLGWALVVVGAALTSTLDEHTARGAGIAYQVVVGCGVGVVWSGAYFPVLAPLDVRLSARALVFFVFVRSFAQVGFASLYGSGTGVS